jgi:hypothetical protein
LEALDFGVELTHTGGGFGTDLFEISGMAFARASGSPDGGLNARSGKENYWHAQGIRCILTNGFDRRRYPHDFTAKMAEC